MTVPNLGITVPPPETRCTGDCCKRFTLPFGPGELAQRYLRNEGLKPSMDGLSLTDEVDTIFEMVIWLGYSDRGGSGHKLEDGRMVHSYTCMNLLPNGDCGIYEHRPRMCSMYPYGQKCFYDGCTWEEASNPIIPASRLTCLSGFRGKVAIEAT